MPGKEGQHISADPPLLTPMPVAEAAGMFLRLVRHAEFGEQAREGLIARDVIDDDIAAYQSNLKPRSDFRLSA